MSLGDGGVQGDANSASAAISADGRFVAFTSLATNLVSGDSNGSWDIFLRDRLHGLTTRLSLSPSGLPANGSSFTPSISADGRLVAFWSEATNLVAGDTNGVADVFVRDVLAGSTRLVSLGTSRAPADGRSLYPAMAPDGRCVAFASTATNLVLHDTNGREDIFVHDLESGKTLRASVDIQGLQGDQDSYNLPSISADGRRVAFQSDAKLAPLDRDRFADVYVRDLQAGTTTLVTISSTGVKANFGGGLPSISAAGDKVAFDSSAWNLVAGDTNGTGDTFVHDLASGRTTRESVSSDSGEARGGSGTCRLSPDGLLLVFSSNASNLVRGDDNAAPDIFVRDLAGQTTTLVSASSRGALANEASFPCAISANGRHIVFSSGADNLVPGDSNGVWDLFVLSARKFRH